MSNAFDPYYKWLGISPAEQPPNYYRLLGIPLYEGNADVISNAADRQMAHIRTFQSGKYSKESQKLLNELSTARVALLDDAKRSAYDAKLRAGAYAAMPTAGYTVPIPPQTPMGMGQPVPPQTPMGMNTPIPSQTPMGMGQPVPPQFPMGMGPQVSTPPQTSMGMMSQVPIPPQAPMGMGPSVPVPPPVRSASVKKGRKPKGDSSKYYIIGGIGAALLLLLFFLMPGSKNDDTRQTAQSEGADATVETAGEDAIDPDEFSLNGFAPTDESGKPLPPRPVQENVMGDTTHSANASGQTAGSASVGDAARSDQNTEKGDEESDDEDGENDWDGEDDEDAFSTSFNEGEADSEGDADSEDGEDADASDESGSDVESDDSEDGAASGVAHPKSRKKKKMDVKSDETGETEDASDSSEGDSAKPEVSEEDIRKLGHGIGLRLAPKRGTMQKFYGVTDETQLAIDSAVAWLMDKQIKEKGVAWWCFDHTILPNKKRPGSRNLMNPGLSRESLVSATSLALMAVLGSGDISSKDKVGVTRGIYFLMYNAKPASDQQIVPMERESAKRIEASLVVEENLDPDFHPHAWGTIAVCDYIALENEKEEKKDKRFSSIVEFAKALVRHLCRQQNENGGFPNLERGLTIDCTLEPFMNSHQASVISTVWNLLALKAAKEAGISVPNETILKATEFLSAKITSIGRNRKGFLGLSSSEIRDVRIALLGIQLYGEESPTYTESVAVAEQILRIYDVNQLPQNFFATMFVRDLRGETWATWRDTVLSQYLKEQSTDKVEKGSWFYDGEKINNEGGRLYCTAMTALILEGAFRFEPLRPLDEYEQSMEASIAEDPEQQPASGEPFAFARPALNEEAEEETEEVDETEKADETEEADETE